MQTKPLGSASAPSPAVAMAQLPQTVPECHAVIAQLLERVKLLEERVNLDSSNSSKQPHGQHLHQHSQALAGAVGLHPE